MPSGALDVGVGLEREDLAVPPGRALARPRDQGEVDVAELHADDGLEQRPGAIHLDVRLVDRGPRADAVDVGDEGERHAGQVVAAASDGEVDVVPIEPGLADHIVDDVHDHDGLGVGVDVVGRGLGDGDDRHSLTKSHHDCSFSSSAATSGSPVGSHVS